MGERVIFRAQSKTDSKTMSQLLCILVTQNRTIVYRPFIDCSPQDILSLEKGSVSIKSLFNMQDKSIFRTILCTSNCLLSSTADDFTLTRFHNRAAHSSF